MQQGMFEGRRGNKRLKAIEKQKEKVLAEFNTEYEESAEMCFLKEDVKWEGTAELIFVMAMRSVNFEWNGLRDHGFLRLCKKWVEEAGTQTLSSKDAATMIKSILPEEMCQELSEELSALEIF